LDPRRAEWKKKETKKKGELGTVVYFRLGSFFERDHPTRGGGHASLQREPWGEKKKNQKS